MRPFRINIERTQFADLRKKVTNSRLAPASTCMGDRRNADSLFHLCAAAKDTPTILMYHGNIFTLPPMGRITQPVGITQFPKDILPVPKTWIERNYNLVQYSDMPYGGHFTAMEAPAPFSKALSEFVSRL